MRNSGPKMSWAFAFDGLAARLEQPDLEHLARVVPLVDRGVDVEALVALEPDEPRAEARREDLGELRLADAGLALEKQGPPEPEPEEHRRRERPVADVVALAEVVDDPLDRVEGGGGRGGLGGLGHGGDPTPRAARSAPGADAARA